MRRKIEVVVCAGCGKKFETNRGTKYCNRACFISTITTGTQAKCLQCDALFWKHKCRPDARFCSRECWYAYKVERSNLELECAECGRVFKRRKSRYERNAAKGRRNFCSRKCSAVYHRNGGVKNRHGYLVVGYTGHPLASASGYLFEHWKALYDDADNKQAIVDFKNNGWTIHHKNGVRDDNALDNLELRAPGKHPHGWTVREMATTLQKLGWTVVAPPGGYEYDKVDCLSSDC